MFEKIFGKTKMIEGSICIRKDITTDEISEQMSKFSEVVLLRGLANKANRILKVGDNWTGERIEVEFIADETTWKLIDDYAKKYGWWIMQIVKP